MGMGTDGGGAKDETGIGDLGNGESQNQASKPLEARPYFEGLRCGEIVEGFRES